MSVLARQAFITQQRSLNSWLVELTYWPMPPTVSCAKSSGHLRRTSKKWRTVTPSISLVILVFVLIRPRVASFAMSGIKIPRLPKHIDLRGGVYQKAKGQFMGIKFPNDSLERAETIQWSHRRWMIMIDAVIKGETHQQSFFRPVLMIVQSVQRRSVNAVVNPHRVIGLDIDRSVMSW